MSIPGFKNHPSYFYWDNMFECTLKLEANELFLFVLLNPVSKSITAEAFLFHIIFHNLSVLPVTSLDISCNAIPQQCVIKGYFGTGSVL